ERLVVRLLVASEVALHVDVDAPASEDPDETIHESADAELMARQRGTSDERDEAGDRSVEIVERQRAFAFRRPHFHPRDQAAEVAVALLRFTEHWKHERLVGRVGPVRRVGKNLFFPTSPTCPTRPTCLEI